MMHKKPISEQMGFLFPSDKNLLFSSTPILLDVTEEMVNVTKALDELVFVIEK
ncbi:MAG: hypothetical protein ACN6OV_09395 [Acinetobacter sp.]|uniref:hypothetical protein n=1 Tax=Acinetobacter sp. TaxID=472 RepID=UPI003CFE9E25